MTHSSITQKISKFWDELPTRFFLMLFMFSDDPGYGRGAWYKQLGGPRELTPRELEDAKFDPDNYRATIYGRERDINEGYDKLMEIRAISLTP